MAIKNISLVRGDNHTFALEFIDIATKLAHDISDWTITLTVKEMPTDLDADALLQKIVTVHDDPTAGKTSIGFVPTDTFDIEPGEYYYDIQAVTDTDAVYTLMRGRFRIEWDCTRAYGTAGTGA